LPPGGTFAWNYSLPDFAGSVKFGAGVGQPAVFCDVAVVPQKLTLDEVGWIKTERLPQLLSRLDAPNALQLRDADAAQPLFDFISADFTAQKLRTYCLALLDEGLLTAIFERLDYKMHEERKHDTGFVRGNVRWQPTVQDWLNRPAETGLSHAWDESRRDFATLPNLLTVFWLRELVGELHALVKLVRNGAPASPRLQNGLSEFEGYAAAFEEGMKRRNFVIQPIIIELERTNFDVRRRQDELQTAFVSTTYPAYARLWELWLAYSRRYVRLPHTDERIFRAGLPPTSKVYELWAACEIAHALGLSANFAGSTGTLFYNRAAQGGWYSAHSRRQPPRPDLRLVTPDKTVLLDVKYRSGSQSRANPDDMYRMLAYMNDLQVKSGGIIFPGDTPAPHLTLLEENGQRLAELQLRPPAADGLADWQAQLQVELSKLIEL
jgi:hypothetical protein